MKGAATPLQSKLLQTRALGAAVSIKVFKTQPNPAGMPIAGPELSHGAWVLRAALRFRRRLPIRAAARTPRGRLRTGILSALGGRRGQPGERSAAGGKRAKP